MGAAPLSNEDGRNKRYAKYKVISWVVSGLALYIAVGLMVKRSFFSLPLLAIALLLLPPLGALVFRLTSRRVSTLHRLVLVVAISFASIGAAALQMWLSNREEAQRAADRAVRLKATLAKKELEQKARLDEFAKIKESLMAEIKQLITEKKWDAAISKASVYEYANDSTIKDLVVTAKTERENADSSLQAFNKERLAELEKIDKSDVGSYFAVYSALAKANPYNKEYRRRADEYAVVYEQSVRQRAKETVATAKKEPSEDVDNIYKLGNAAKGLNLATDFKVSGWNQRLDLFVGSMLPGDARDVASGVCDAAKKMKFQAAWEVRAFLVVGDRPAATCKTK
jgi:hypothetical protein